MTIRFDDLQRLWAANEAGYDGLARDFLARPLFKETRHMDTRQDLIDRIRNMGAREVDELHGVIVMRSRNAGAELADTKGIGRADREVTLAAQAPGRYNLDTIEDLMAYQPWGPAAQEAGAQVREALTAAAKAILRVAPAGRYRDRAVELVLDARMQANAAISFNGRF